MESRLLFIEATLPNEQGYSVMWRQPETASVDEAFEQALFHLATLNTPNRLELWSKAHAECGKGFAPMAFRDANSSKVMVCNTLKMLAGI